MTVSNLMLSTSPFTSRRHRKGQQQNDTGQIMSQRLSVQGHAVNDSSWLSAVHSWHSQGVHHSPSAGKHWLSSSMALHAWLTKACLLMGCIATGCAVPPACQPPPPHPPGMVNETAQPVLNAYTTS